MIHIPLLSKEHTELKLRYLHVISLREVCFVCCHVFAQCSEYPVINFYILGPFASTLKCFVSKATLSVDGADSTSIYENIEKCCLAQPMQEH